MTEPFSFQDRRGRDFRHPWRSGAGLPAVIGSSERSQPIPDRSDESQQVGFRRTAANLQMALLKTASGILMDKGIPFNTEDPKELSEARKLW